MKLRYTIPLLLLLTLGSACAPKKKIVVETAPEKTAAAQAQFDRAEKLYGEHAYAAAAAEFLKFAADYPAHLQAPAALMQAGSAYFMAGDYETARKVYRPVEAGYPGTIEIKN